MPVGWALLAIWLQVIFSGLHMASAAHALGGPVENEAAIWTICTAQGNHLLPADWGEPETEAATSSTSRPAQHDIETLCALCASGLADGMVLNLPQPTALRQISPYHSKRTLLASDRAWRWQSPRVGASRAPPSV